MKALMEMPLEKACQIKYEMGRAEHRAGESDEFIGDPVLEFYMEMLDAINYIPEIEKRGYKVPPFLAAAIRFGAEWSRELHSS